LSNQKNSVTGANKLSEIKTNLREKINAANKEAAKRRAFISISASDFKEIFLLQMDFILSEKGLGNKYVLDKDNSSVINQIYLYLVGSDEFSGNINKGLLLMGSIGTGKTMIINAIISIIEELTVKRFTKVHAKALFSLMKNKDDGYFDKRPVFIDDIGKEIQEVNDYGTKTNPVPELFAIRYDYNSWTFATCNYNEKELTELYGETIVDRFKELFNVLILEGDSRRK
jgi:DNA replication protein DnaC